MCSFNLIREENSSQDERLLSFKIAFRGTVDINDVAQALRLAMKALALEGNSTSPLKSTTTLSAPSSSLGLSAIMKNLEVATKYREEAVAESSFNDLETLMNKAAELTKLAESLLSKISKSSSSEKGLDEDVVFRRELVDFGILQPVTKEASGRSFVDDLAKELGDFLLQYSQRNGIMQISLSDAFCVFNRARGVSLVSPQDIYQASALLKSKGLKFQLRTYDSGVHVLESLDFNDAAVMTRIQSLVEGSPAGITAADLARDEKVSVLVAKEQLLVRWFFISYPN